MSQHKISKIQKTKNQYFPKIQKFKKSKIQSSVFSKIQKFKNPYKRKFQKFKNQKFKQLMETAGK